MYYYGYNSGYGYGAPGCYSACCGYPGYGYGGGGYGGFGSSAAIILVLFILLVIVIAPRFIGPVGA